MNIVSAIYVILNTVNGKLYIGSAKNISKRWYEHRRRLNAGIHPNPHLQAAWNKYGAKAFKFKVLEHCPEDQLEAREQHFIDIHMPRKICYNIAPNTKNPFQGRKHSDDTRRKMSEAKKNQSAETRSRIGAAHKGKINSAETKRLISEAQKLRWARKRAGMNGEQSEFGDD